MQWQHYCAVREAQAERNEKIIAVHGALNVLGFSLGRFVMQFFLKIGSMLSQK